jgi:hypothetical protein
MQDITLPEVTALKPLARFFKDDNGRDMVEISHVGSKDTFVKKVGPEEMAKFKPEWDAHCDGKPLMRRPGTALTDLKSINQERADYYVSRNIHNLEELAALSDMQCQGVGHGTLTDRTGAQGLLMQRNVQINTEQRDRVGRAAATIGVAPVDTPRSEEIAAIGVKIDGLVEGMNALVGLLTQQAQKQKGGRPPKDKKEA